MANSLKLCFCSSSGGHYWELLQLKSLASKYNSFVITENMDFKMENLCEKTYYLPQINRKMFSSIFLFFLVSIKSLAIIIREKPSHIISSGALFTFPIMFIGKLLGIKIAFFELQARADSKSLTGKLIHPFANLFIVQWDSMLKLYRKAVLGSM